MRSDPLSKDQATQVYDALVLYAGASPAGRAMFIHHQTHEHCAEYRFQGSLGFGGKFWRNDKLGPNGWEEAWYVNAYREDETPRALEIIRRTNAVLALVLRTTSKQTA